MLNETPTTTETPAAPTASEVGQANHFPEECARARGEEQIPADEAAFSIIGAHCDYSARLQRREHWYRMAWRGGVWKYISEPLMSVGIRAAERHQTRHGEVWPGEIIAQHDRGKAVDMMYLIVKVPNGDIEKIKRESLHFRKRRDGRLDITLPDQTLVTLPDPRR